MNLSPPLGVLAGVVAGVARPVSKSSFNILATVPKHNEQAAMLVTSNIRTGRLEQSQNTFNENTLTLFFYNSHNIYDAV